MTIWRRARAVALLAFLIGVGGTACSALLAGVVPGDDVEDEAARLEEATLLRLEREARAIARQDGCRDATTCRAVPVGVKPCGGPRAYLIYCPLTTDTVALLQKLEALRTAEDAFRRRGRVDSTCDYVLPPTLRSVGGVCQAAD